MRNETVRPVRYYDGSMNARLMAMAVGERRYIETTRDDYARTMRAAVVPRSRRHPELNEREFTATLFTAVSARRAGDVRLLVCVERTR